MADELYPLKFKPTFARQAGAQMVATMVTTALYGVAILMVIQYFFRHSRKDPLWIKTLVASLGILATLETIFANHQIYEDFVARKDDPAAYNFIHFSMPGKTACIFLAAFLSQMFYASRIWKLGRITESQFRYAVIPIVALALLQLGGGLIQVVVMNTSKTYAVMNTRVWLNIRSMYINGAATAACDILITIALVIILHSTEVNATRRTKSLVEKLVTYAINRGIFTSVFALLSIFLYDFASGTLYYLIPFSLNTHVYTVSVISMLAVREGLREDMGKSFHVSDLIMKTLSQRSEHGTAPNPSETDVNASKSTADKPEQDSHSAVEIAEK